MKNKNLIQVLLKASEDLANETNRNIEEITVAELIRWLIPERTYDDMVDEALVDMKRIDDAFPPDN